MAHLGFVGALIWGLGASIGAGKHWYQQLKPFANQEERERAFKEQVVESGALTHLWPKHVEQYWLNAPAGTMVQSDPEDSILLEIVSKKLQLGPSYPFSYHAAFFAKNCWEQVQNLQMDTFALAHEGSHGVQPLLAFEVDSFLKQATGILDKMAKLRFDYDLTAYLPMAIVDEEGHVEKVVTASYVQRRDPVSDSTSALRERYNKVPFVIPSKATFAKSLIGKDSQAMHAHEQAIAAVLGYNDASSLLQHTTASVIPIFKAAGTSEARREARKYAREQLEPLHMHTRQVLQRIKLDFSHMSRVTEHWADAQALHYIQTTETMSSEIKIKSLQYVGNVFKESCKKEHERLYAGKFFKEYCKKKHMLSCEKPESSHPPCKDRIDAIHKAIADIKLLAIQEQAAEQMSLFIDPLHS